MISFDRPRLRGIGLGLVGGLVGTWLMDVAIVTTFILAGESGDAFFVMVGERLGQGAWLGVVLHNLIGLSGGFLFAIAVMSVPPLRIERLRKGLVFGVLVGAVTIPAGCIPLAIWLGKPVLTVIAFSAVPHMIYGVVLGFIVSYGILRWTKGPG